MLNILFLCTGNSCRSQMAEGWGKHFHPQKFRFFSAGLVKHGLNPRAVLVMEEAGVDICEQKSNTTNEICENMDIVFTVCSNAQETCPIFPAAKITHVGFDDPPTLTKEMKNEEEILEVYRRVRDEIKDFVLRIDEYL